jgi:hypothetical protein
LRALVSVPKPSWRSRITVSMAATRQCARAGQADHAGTDDDRFDMFHRGGIVNRLPDVASFR